MFCRYTKRIVTLTVVLLLAACAITETQESRYSPPAQPSTPTQNKAQHGSLKIAVIVPLSGENKALGQAFVNASILSMQHVAPKLGLNPANIVIMPRDSASSPRNAAQTALAEGANVIIGPLFANNIPEISASTGRVGVPVYSLSNNIQYANNGVYLMGFMPDQQAYAVLEYAYMKGRRNFAAVLPDNPYGKAIEIAFRSFGKMHDDAKVLTVEYYNSQASAISTTKGIMNTFPALDAVFAPEGGEMLAGIAKATSANPQIKLLGSMQWEGVGNNNPSLYGAWFAGSNPQQYKVFESKYAASFGSTPPRISSIAFDSTAMILTYFASGIMPANIPTQLNGRSFTAPVDGLLEFTAGGILKRGYNIMEIQQEGYKIISGNGA